MIFDVPENIISILLEAIYSIEDSAATDSSSYQASSEICETGRQKFRITES